MSPLRELPIINVIAHGPEKVHQPGVDDMTERKVVELKSEEELAAEEEAKAVAEKEQAAKEEEENGGDEEGSPIDGTNADADAGVTSEPQEPTER